MDFAARFETGLSYTGFLDRFGTDEHRTRWAAVHDQVSLTDAQTELLASFTRDMKVIVLAGTWCGDCVNQCPIFDRFAAATSKIDVRYFDRDDSADLATELSVCGGQRVPAIVFLSEDGPVIALWQSIETWPQRNWEQRARLDSEVPTRPCLIK
jgi:thiol-disulfide isomerase/thioredoxin